MKSGQFFCVGFKALWIFAYTFVSSILGNMLGVNSGIKVELET